MSQVWVWGLNSFSQLNPQSTETAQKIPLHLKLTSIKKISCGATHTLILTNEYQVYSVGSGGFGKLGHGDFSDLSVPRLVKEFSRNHVVDIAATNAHSMALDREGNIYTWGCAFFGRLGLGTNQKAHVPTPTIINSPNFYYEKNWKFSLIACGGNSSIAVAASGMVYVWGYNKSKQLGLPYNTLEYVSEPYQLSMLQSKGICQVSVGDSHMMALTSKGEVYVWGSNEYGQLGTTPHSQFQYTPKVIDSFRFSKIVQISAGETHSACLTSTGLVYVFGNGSDGRLGLGSYSNQNTPKLVEKIQGKVIQVECGTGHTIALTDEGKVWTWGLSKHGQLGHETIITEDIKEPFMIEKLYNVTRISAGAYHNAALIESNIGVLHQHIINKNWNDAYDFIQENKKLVEVIEERSGYNALHWSVILGDSTWLGHIHTILPNANFTICDKKGKTPLHLCVRKEGLDCLKFLLNRMDVVQIINQKDNEGNTALKIAIEKKIEGIPNLLVEYGASLEILDNDGYTPIDYCTLQEAFELKRIAKYHDVFILCDENDIQFAQNLSKAIEENYIKCRVVDEKDFLLAYIEKSKGVIFVVSNSSISPEGKAIALLRKTKEYEKVQVFPIWKDRVVIDPSLESLIYRRQLVDFSKADQFRESVSQLVNGLRNIFLKDDGEDFEDEEIDEVDDQHQIDHGHHSSSLYVYICHDISDSKFVHHLKHQLFLHRIAYYKVPKGVRATNDDVILKCCVFLFIVSQRGLNSTQLRDHMALAENHKIPILPIFVPPNFDPSKKYSEKFINSNINLDPAMQYSLALAPRFFSDPISLSQLFYTIKLHEKLQEMKGGVNVVKSAGAWSM